jgi:hypothetical protein
MATAINGVMSIFISSAASSAASAHQRHGEISVKSVASESLYGGNR